MKLKYREDIDGLRAIAVLSVVLNHAGIGLFSGGFIGVDVFFVISGYLITKIIINDVHENLFSLIKFYERRIRRIFPALFAVMAFTFAICVLIYDPDKLSSFGKSVVATTFFVSNINFWRESGYFDTSSQLKPLLHTWSLAVEEQFYIVFPLLMVALIRFFKKSAVIILSIMAVISFAFSIYLVSKNPTTSFYLTHLRAWELLVGAILSLSTQFDKINKKYGNFLGLIGVAMILIPVFTYTASTPFPGLSATLPVLGTGLAIWSGTEDRSTARRLLSLSPLVFVGKISYSLYLWHWPIVVFEKYLLIRPLTGFEIAFSIVIIFVLSIFSWHYIETPFRLKGGLQTRGIFIFAAAAMTSMLMAGSFLFLSKGLPNRFGLETESNGGIQNDRWEFNECNINSTDIPGVVPVCKIGQKSQTPSFIVWGDSHAPSAGKGIHTAATSAGLSGVLTYEKGCPTLLGVITKPQLGDVSCASYNNMVLQYINGHPEIQTVILVSRWTIWVEGTPYKQEEGGNYFLSEADNKLAKEVSQDALFTLGLEGAIKALTNTNRTVVIVTPIPEIGYDPSSSNFIALHTGRETNEIIAPSTKEYLARNQKTFEILNMLATKYNVQLVNPWKILCNEEKCLVTIDGTLLYKDNNHLSTFGSELIAPAFDPIFKPVK
jgi:peptidoglycan/LPS O-acetylase OafA/YrhL